MGSQVAQNWQTAPASKQTTTIHNSVTMTVNHHGEFNEKHAKQITDHVMSALDKKSRQQAYATYPNSVHTSKYSHGLGSD
jgi:hypothetical protein